MNMHTEMLAHSLIAIRGTPAVALNRTDVRTLPLHLCLLQIFYTKDFALERPTNPEAQRLFRDDKEAFAARVQACVQQSLAHRYDAEPGCSMRLTEPRPAHAALEAKVLGSNNSSSSNRSSIAYARSTGSAASSLSPKRPPASDAAP
jgi:hypothetical protein